ncbi:hypothetical protein J2I47_25660 [Fibrella sp. HMF5335]|uniref:Uncharacterized protein n=1 Tax=Fibrella rubiginis TaxID=2817060 RepID=A0A939GL98_9BACT|nr:hypothetical protein [Fibrella rubiginis]MBO0939958.1 hypothetical protein [Fibrella rubiginis]
MSSNGFPLFGLDFEADSLPFGPAQPDPENRRDAPVLLLDIANTIRGNGGQVWHVGKLTDSSGMLFRANIGRRQFRVFAPMPGGKQPLTAPQEKGTPVHVVSTLPALQNWLASFGNDGI